MAVRSGSRVSLTLLAAALVLQVPVAEPSEPAEFEMVTYHFVLLHAKPGARPLDERERVRLQQEHLSWLGGLYQEGKVLLSGPLSLSGDLQGVLVLDVPTREEAEAIVARDPWVREGRHVPEIHPWWAAKGIVRKPDHLLYPQRCWLGLYRRPEGAPDYPPERLREIQEGHLANLRAMADSGDLVLAGPLGDDGVLRGILVFRDRDPERLRELVARDPAVKAGRLSLGLYPWSVPAGTLP
jgi:uncharacterized protein YciI